MRRSARWLRSLSVLTTAAVTATCLASAGTVAHAAEPVLPVPALPTQRTADMVSADSLPTVQIDNGVVWSQAIVGNTVYAGGQFSQTRAPGAAAGQQLTPRSNLLAYDLRSGELLPFNHVVNGTVRAVTASPDGSRVYIGGSFTAVDGKGRYGVAAFDTKTGDLLDSFDPPVGGTGVYAIAATDSTVYLGGRFTQVYGDRRSNLAAVTSTGQLTAWAPTTDNQVDGMVMAPSDDRVIIAGRFVTVNGATAKGSAALDATTGASRQWIMNKVVTNSTNSAGTWGLNTDGKTIYGAAWSQSLNGGNLEGLWAADPNDGSVVWRATAGGDHYDVFAEGGALYSVGHTHKSTMYGGWPDMKSPSGNYQFSEAVTADPRGTGALGDYWNNSGLPAPAEIQWYPSFYSGKFTGMGQAGWSVTGNKDYVIIGGEFPGLNGENQYGLARFARPSVVKPTTGPRLVANPWTSAEQWSAPAFTATPGGARISIQPNFDRDDRILTYELYRDGTSGPVARAAFASDSWKRTSQTVTLVDTSAPLGKQVTYRVKAIDSDGNSATSPAVTGTTSTEAVPDYVNAVRQDGAEMYWRFGGSTPTQDWSGALTTSTTTGLSWSNNGVVSADATAWAGSSTLTSSSSAAIAATDVSDSTSATVETWLRTTTTRGGQIAGLGAASSGNSSVAYRSLYMSADGRITFGISPDGDKRTVTTPKAYNDGSWHHIAATVGSTGMRLYVDGVLAASDANVTSAGSQQGFWRVGNDNAISAWPGAPATSSLTGDVAEFAVYPTALTPARIVAHRNIAMGTPVPTEPPTAAFTSRVSANVVSVDASGSKADGKRTIDSYAWDFGDGGTGNAKTATHTYAKPGTYTIRLTVTDDSGATDQTTTTITVSSVIAEDSFDRTGSTWGSADTGGTWTVQSGMTTDGKTGKITSPNPGAMRTGWLTGTNARDVDLTLAFSSDKVSAGGSAMFQTAVRHTAAGDYRTKITFNPGGTMSAYLTKMVGSDEVIIKAVGLANTTYQPGDVFRLRFQAVSADDSTALKARVWKDGTAEPASWTLQATDGESDLQGPGQTGVVLYLSSASTAAPQTISVDDLKAIVP